VISRPPAQRALKDFVFVELYTDKLGGGANDKNREIQDQRFKSTALPLYVVIGPDGRERGRLTGIINNDEFLAFLAKHKGP